MSALELTFATMLLAQPPSGAPVTIPLRPPAVGDLQVLRIQQVSDRGDRMRCDAAGGKGPHCWLCNRREQSRVRRSRIVAVHGGRIRSYQVTYDQLEQKNLPCGRGRMVSWPPSIGGLSFLVGVGAGIPVLTDPQGARLPPRQAGELFWDHSTFGDLHALPIPQRRLVVNPGSRVAPLEKALDRTLGHLLVGGVGSSGLELRYTGIGHRKGQRVGLFSIRTAPIGPPDLPIASSTGDGCLGLRLQDGRMDSLELRSTARTRHRMRNWPPSVERRGTVSISAEYP